MENFLKVIIPIMLYQNMGSENSCSCLKVATKQPNIVFILADDMGYNDIGYHNPSIISPNIDNLARSGIKLEQNYVQPQCTPSRAALLTGMYPYHIGRQGGIIQPKGNQHRLIYLNAIQRYLNMFQIVSKQKIIFLLIYISSKKKKSIFYHQNTQVIKRYLKK